MVYAASALAVVYYAGDSRSALGMALVSPPLVMQLGMTSCSYDGDDSVLEPGARVFDLSAWKALCCRRPHSVDDDDEVVWVHCCLWLAGAGPGRPGDRVVELAA